MQRCAELCSSRVKEEKITSLRSRTKFCGTNFRFPLRARSNPHPQSYRTTRKELAGTARSVRFFSLFELKFLFSHTSIVCSCASFPRWFSCAVVRRRRRRSSVVRFRFECVLGLDRHTKRKAAEYRDRPTEGTAGSRCCGLEMNLMP